MMVLESGLLVVDLRNPEFGNKERLEVARINRTSQGGDVIVYRDSSWPVTQTFDYELANLTQRQAQAVLDFLNLTVGQTVTLSDYEGTTRSGVITTPAAEVEQTGINMFRVAFTFQAS